MSRLCALALIVFSLSPSWSEAATIENFRSGNWFVGAYTDDATGRFSHCAMSTGYQSGIYMAFSVTRDFQWILGFADPRWKLVPRTVYDLQFSIDGGGPIAAQATAVRADFVEIPMQGNRVLFERFRRGYQLHVQAVGQDFFFNLTGTARGLSALLNCTQRHVVAMQPSMSTNPFAISSNQAQRSTDRSAFKAEATTLVANLLSQSGISGFKILEPQEVPEQWQGWDVVWTAPGVIGTMLVVLPVQNQSLDDIRSVLIAADARGCKGKFASGSLPQPSMGAPALQVFTACELPTTRAAAYYLVLPRSAGGYYVTATLGADADAQRAEADEAQIRDAAFKVMAH